MVWVAGKGRSGGHRSDSEQQSASLDRRGAKAADVARKRCRQLQFAIPRTCRRRTMYVSLTTVANMMLLAIVVAIACFLVVLLLRLRARRPPIHTSVAGRLQQLAALRDSAAVCADEYE